MKTATRVRKTKKAWLRALKKYSAFIGSKTFQYANEGTKQYAYADRRTGELEDQVEFKFQDYKEAMDAYLKEAVREAAQFKAATSRMDKRRAGRDDLWYGYTKEDMERAQAHPQRFINGIEVEAQ